MELKQLETFVQVAQMGSFSRASVALRVTQPALSRQIRALEVELRQSLFRRHGRGVALTEPGEILLSHARKALHEIALAREQLRGQNGQLAGRVSVGMPPSIARLLTVPLARRVRRELPSAIVSIHEGTTLSMQELIADGRIDFALVYQLAPITDLEVTPLREERLFLIAADEAQGTSGTSISLRELADLPLIMPGRPSVIRMLVEARLATLGLRPRIAVEVEGAGGILSLVSDGAGYAVLPLTSVRAMPRQEEFCVRTLSDPAMSCELAIVSSVHRSLTATQGAVRELMQHLVTALLEDTARAVPPIHRP